MKKFLSVFLILAMVFSITPSSAFAMSISESYYGSGPIRSMTIRQDGVVVGGRSSGHKIEVWASSDNGNSWSQIGSVAQNDNISYGDVMFLAVPQTDTIFCAFREKNNSTNHYAVTVCRSDDGGYNWVYDSTVISGCTQFVGAPWLFIAQNGDLQCYYDSEPLAAQNGVSGAQWIAMQGRDGLTGSWDKYGVVAASRDADASKFIRDGMASVVDLGNNRIMLVTEGIEESPSGGVYANVVRAIQSFDGGYTWNYSGRKIVYQSSIDSASGKRYNAYCPMAIRVGNGPVGVVFCTDEDFGGTPDASNETVTNRRSHIKYIRTLENFETWGGLTSVWTEGSNSYAPGMIETASNEVLISIDHFNGNQRFYQMDVLANDTDKTPLSNIEGKTLFFLGSSVTYGYASGGVSFADYIAQRNNCISVKEAVSGTTLTDNGSNSYVQRMINNLDTSADCDHFICQLSTNDASQNKPLGSVSSSYDLNDFDTSTITGAMEYIIAYASTAWGCPVSFYTSTYYNSTNYQAMVDTLYKLQEKWGIGIIDLWNNESMRNVSSGDRSRYMADDIHPTAAGYEEWWTPVFEEYLQNFDYTNYTLNDDAAVIPGTGDVLYSNNFGSSSGLEYYSGLASSAPVYNNNTLIIEGGNSNKVVAADKIFTDFVVEADIMVTEDRSKNSNQGGIIFRAANAYSGVSDGYDGYYFGIDALKNEAILGKVHGNQWIEIAKKKMTVEYGRYYHVSVAVSGNVIEGYVNYNGTNYAKIVAADNDFSSGSVGVRHWLAPASFKNLKVSAYTPETVTNGYTNAVLDSCADPDVLYYNGVYYLYSTNSSGADEGIKVYSSTDLVNWTDRGWALLKNDVYGTSGFWAPDIIEKDGIFYMYYAANEHLSVAAASSPIGPFTQTEAQQVPIHTDIKEIDAHVFKDDDGQYYIYFVRFYDGSGNAGGNHIWGAKLNPDMRTIDESTLTCLISPTESWETDMAAVVEGPFMLKKDGVYYLTYSGSHFQSNLYGSGYATSTNPLGTYIKYENNPIMQSNSMVHGAGHHCVTESPDGSELFMVYHCHKDLATVEPRSLCIDRIHFTTDDAGNTVLEVLGPTVTMQPLPSGSNTSEAYGYPDMVVTDISWTPASPESGDQVIFSATVRNQGTGVADAGIINGLQFQIDGQCVSWSDDNTDQIQPGETVTLTACSGPNGTASWNAAEGTRTVTAWINDIIRYPESNTDNNTYSKTITVGSKTVQTTASPAETQASATTAAPGVTGGYDLIVTDIAWGGTAISAGTNVIWTVTVKNNGDTDIPSGTIIGYQVQVDGDTSNITWCDSYSGGLKAGDSVVLTCNGGSSGNNYWTATNGTHSIMAWVDDVNRLTGEVNENNNQYTISLTIPFVPAETTAAPEMTKAPETTTAPETTQAPETTAAPETTKAPETTQAPETTKAEELTTEAPETTAAVSLPFTDVPEAYWAYSSIAECYMNGWILGTSATAFSPDDTVTRAQFMTILGRFDSADVSSYTSSKFVDVSFSSWGYAPYVAWAEANGIANGTDSTHFSPHSKLTRAQLIVFLNNYANSTGAELEVVNPDISFSDYSSIPSYARASVMAMAQAGVISGDSEKFDPNSPCTRAMVADFLVRFNRALNGTAE